MYASFDESTKELTMLDTKAVNQHEPYQIHPHFDSYCDFFKAGSTAKCTLEKEFAEIGRLCANRAVDMGSNWGDIIQKEFSVRIVNIRYGDTRHKLHSNKDDKVLTVNGYIYHNGESITGTETVPILRFPYMNRYGVIEREGREYSIVMAYEPDKYVTYSGNEKDKVFEIMCHKVKLAFRPGSNTVEFYNNKKKFCSIYDLIQAAVYLNSMYMMGESSFHGFIDTNQNMFQEKVPKYINIDSFEDDMAALGTREANYIINKGIPSLYAYGNVDPAKATPIFQQKRVLLELFDYIIVHSNDKNAFSVEHVREDLNDILSLDRAVGRVTAKDVLGEDGTVILKQGALVNELDIKALNMARTRYVHVRPTEDFSLYITAVGIEVRRIPAGFEIDEVMATYAPELLKDKVGILSEDLVFYEKQFIIPHNVNATQTIITIARDCDCVYHAYEEKFDEAEVGAISSKLNYSPYSGESSSNPRQHMFLPVWKNPLDEFGNTAKTLSKVTELPIVETIVSNRHYKDENDEWKYWDGSKFIDAAPVITYYDLLSLATFLPALYSGRYKNRVNNRDIGMRKKVSLIGDMFHTVLNEGISREIGSRWARAFRTYMSRESLNSRYTGDKIGALKKDFITAANYCNNAIWEKFGGDGHKYVSILSVSNPYAHISDLMKVPTITKGKHAVSRAMQFLAMGFMGRICPYETPASHKLGLVNNIACRAKIIDGKLCAPFIPVIRVDDKHVKVDLSTEPVWMDVQKQENFIVSDFRHIVIDKNTCIADSSQIVPAIVPDFNEIEKMAAADVPLYMVDYVISSADVTLGHVATTIPYIGSNDTSRVTYGLSMAKQAVPLIHREAPRLATFANKSILWNNPKFAVVAEYDGVVTAVRLPPSRKRESYGSIFLQVDYSPHCVMPQKELDTFKEGANNNPTIMDYCMPLSEYYSSSVIIREVKVEVGQRVKKGDLLISSNFVDKGMVSLGVNAIVCEVSTGHNYEDAVHMSQRLSDKMTSYYRRSDTFRPPMSRCTIKDLNTSMYIESNSDPVFNWKHRERAINIKESKRIGFSDKLKGFPIFHAAGNTAKLTSESKCFERIVNTLELSRVDRGDKTANRHGNKGVDAIVMPNSKMLCFDNGEMVDLVYNPIGVASRMNNGQLLELPHALMAYIADFTIITQSMNEPQHNDYKDFYLYMWHCIEEGVDNVLPPKWLPENFIKYLKSVEWKLESWRGILDEDCRARLFDPETGRYLDTRVTVGVNYVYKLEQMVDHKKNSRGGVFKEGQLYKHVDARPDKGAKVAGGQSLGRQELNALLAHNATGLIHESFHEKGDNPLARAKFAIEHLVLNGEDDSRTAAVLRAIYDATGKGERRAVTKFRALSNGLNIDYFFDDIGENEIRPNDIEEYKDDFIVDERYLTGAKSLSGRDINNDQTITSYIDFSESKYDDEEVD